MSSEFLVSIMHFAIRATGAERGMAVDLDLNVCGVANLDEHTIKAKHFIDIASSTLHESIQQDEAIITNNIITDPSDAPTTNTSFSDLRVVVAIPVQGTGAVYLDQHIRQGVIARETINQVHEIVRKLQSSDRLDASADDMMALFDA